VSEFEADSVSEGSGLDIGNMGLDDSEDASEISEVEVVKKGTSASKKKTPVIAKSAPQFKIGGTSFDLGKKASFKTQTKNKSKGGSSKTKQANEMDVDDEDEEGHGADTDDEMMRAAIRASFVTAADEIRREFSSAGAGPSNSADRMSMSVSPAKKTNGLSNGRKSTSKKGVVESDSDDEPLVQKGKKGASKSKKGSTIKKMNVQDDDDDSDDDFALIRGGEDASSTSDAGTGMDVDEDENGEEDSEDEEEVIRVWQLRKENDRQAKLIQRKEEAVERKRLGRKLTYVSICLE
jgi:hypothetical protein